MSGFLKTARKRGADMTQALLYAAFAIIVLISVLAMYQIVSLNAKKEETTRVMNVISSEIRTMARGSAANMESYINGSASFEGRLIDLGIVPQSAVSDGDIVLPYNGTLEAGGFAINGAHDETFYMQIMFMNASRGGRALCAYLGSGSEYATQGAAPAMIENGPLGANYTVINLCSPTTAGVGSDGQNIALLVGYHL